MRAKLRHASDLAQKGEHEKAIAFTKEVESDLTAHGILSAHTLWVLAVFHDYGGHLFEALDYVLRALRADPALVPGESSLHIITAKCRESLVDGDLGAEEGIRLYNALAANGLADDYCRVAFARFLLESGDTGEALRVAQALVLLNPGNTEAWRIVQSAAEALGDEKLAAEAAGRCMAARCASGPSPAPNVSWGQA